MKVTHNHFTITEFCEIRMIVHFGNALYSSNFSLCFHFRYVFSFHNIRKRCDYPIECTKFHFLENLDYDFSFANKNIKNKMFFF